MSGSSFIEMFFKSRICRSMLTIVRLPAKIPCHTLCDWYPAYLGSSWKLLSIIFCSSSSMKLGPGVEIHLLSDRLTWSAAATTGVTFGYQGSRPWDHESLRKLDLSLIGINILAVIVSDGLSIVEHVLWLSQCDHSSYCLCSFQHCLWCYLSRDIKVDL